MAVDLFDNWFDPLETEVRTRAREFIEERIRGELDTVLARPRYSRRFFLQNPDGVPGNPQALLGATILGPRIFLHDQWQRH
jgi:hypothetical protein